ncbi:TPA: XRE family transcriptional regulator [Listeria monocytogenes]|nr:helix-turn-helix domain-containing protein [Listeria monocytogenes]HAA9071023.1 Cro/Cl family transcriptional regulator [Listeria monocytogenes]HDI4828576.1 XRE family transcriptional regulator [Listeria monocytogenes]HDM9928157.1 XRE family transcriptional regulator [Listeria monocytogenes]
MDELKKTIQQLKEKRLAYGISQNKLAVLVGITRHYVGLIETGKASPSEKLLAKLQHTLETLNPQLDLEMIFDYVRIRFPTNQPEEIIEKILKLKMKYMLHEDFAFYSYDEQYIFGDIAVMVSHKEEKGVMIEMKGQGCRQFEHFLLAQKRTWFDFFLAVFDAEGIFKRLDLAVNDKVGLLDIPELVKKCEAEECVSIFRTFKNYRSGDLVHKHEKFDMGNTLYIGSMQTDIYFCIYEKDYEQYVKHGIPLEESPVKNRFEIRLKNERALQAIIDLISNRDLGETIFAIINRYMRFADKEPNKRRTKWKMNANWAYFLGQNQRRLKLTLEPEPYNYTQTLRWLAHQVAPTLKSALFIDKINGTQFIENIVLNAELTEKHLKIIEQQTLPVEEVIIS